jgi:hypothetical protein
MASRLALHDELWFIVLKFTDLPTLAQVAQTSKKLYQITQFDFLWNERLSYLWPKSQIVSLQNPISQYKQFSNYFFL